MTRGQQVVLNDCSLLAKDQTNCLQNIEMITTGAGKATNVMSPHFYFHDDRSDAKEKLWEKESTHHSLQNVQNLTTKLSVFICFHTFKMTGDGKATTVLSPHFHNDRNLSFNNKALP